MSSSMKYIGAATDPGEWWSDKRSAADDLGPGVSFTVRCGEDGGDGPRLILCYGLREDVKIKNVEKEAQRIIAEYQKPDRWNRNGGTLQGALHAPRLEQWPTREDVITQFEKHVIAHHEYARSTCRQWWRIEDVMDILWAVTGSGAMAERVVELIGMRDLRKMCIPDDEIMRKWPLVAVDENGVPQALVETGSESVKGTWMEHMLLRPSTKEDVTGGMS